MKRLFDHLDLRVRDLAVAKPFYEVLLPALGFPSFCPIPHGISYDAVRQHPKPEFIALIEDRDHRANATRIAFWADTKEEIDRFHTVLSQCGALNVEGPSFWPEYTPTYYAVFFEDPFGNRFELCCRTAQP